ncbi:DgyrCDS3430 [Dimorphilus gyrociliatus]|uniref:DgyrCDS3430 n=1 Tax=Dimorphilus gyrociliatus TaxID=2664684 RepID=A0A7I8VF46_9ANNE|nr:DgyrCDS3430 [Dimorphilus gyrociliatus]
MQSNCKEETRSIKDRMKFFEKEIAEHNSPSKKKVERKFSYLQEHEVAKMKKEDERKMSLMSQEELKKLMSENVADFSNVLKSWATGDDSKEEGSKAIRLSENWKEGGVRPIGKDLAELNISGSPQ